MSVKFSDALAPCLMVVVGLAVLVLILVVRLVRHGGDFRARTGRDMHGLHRNASMWPPVDAEATHIRVRTAQARPATKRKKKSWRLVVL